MSNEKANEAGVHVGVGLYGRGKIVVHKNNRTAGDLSWFPAVFSCPGRIPQFITEKVMRGFLLDMKQAADD
ncbi:hypothetical protein [Paenibacillus dakarensis]|uniref:hypothetical protein n=1 Tax=Paenibacillus dakarensis TaxID=1527293 RepID=UPI0006D545B1|nr:hypothetical protein [Paenibacillus dakarensis]